MPLNPAVLQGELLRIFKAKLDNPVEIGRQKAVAYQRYAQAGSAGGTFPIFTGLEVGVLQGILTAAIADPVIGLPPKYAGAWSAGLASFWGTPPVPFAGPPATGVSAPPVGVAALLAALTASVSNPLNTEETTSISMAGAIHAATLTVVVVGTTVGGQPFSAPLL